MQEREAAIRKIMAACPYTREEVEDLLADWDEAKGVNYANYVPDEDIDEIIEALREEVRWAA
jgi:hypothetical protein